MVESDDARVRALLRTGDLLVKAEDYSGALRAYAEAARWYGSTRFPLKAIAVWKQIRDVVRREAPHETTVDQEARTALVPLFRGLGLEQEALAIEAERKPSSSMN